jgi:hypothetical protein
VSRLNRGDVCLAGPLIVVVWGYTHMAMDQRLGHVPYSVAALSGRPPGLWQCGRSRLVTLNLQAPAEWRPTGRWTGLLP